LSRIKSADLPGWSDPTRAAHPSAHALLKVAAQIASSVVSPNRQQAISTEVCMLSVGVWCGLKLVPKAIGTPASISARAGGTHPAPADAHGRSVAMMPASASFAARFHRRIPSDRCSRHGDAAPFRLAPRDPGGRHGSCTENPSPVRYAGTDRNRAQDSGRRPRPDPRIALYRDAGSFEAAPPRPTPPRLG